jgi:hypothetical protein
MRPAIKRRSVVLPEPDSPTIASASPSSISKEMSRQAWIAP